MTARDCIVLVDDDRDIVEGLAMILERPGRTVVLCSDVESAQIALERFPVTHVVSDVQFSGSFGFEGLHFLRRIREQQPSCVTVLISGAVTDDLEAEARKHGATAVLSKPFAMAEFEDALGGAAAASAAEFSASAPAAEAAAAPLETPYEVIRIPSIEEILDGGSLAAAFQPIVRMTADGVQPFAYEALTRVRGNWLAGGPVMLFDYASRRSRLAELNLVTMRCAIADAAKLPENATLFFNIDPLTFGTRELVPALLSSCEAAGITLPRVVLEVTERSAFADDAVAARTFDELHDWGIRFALDDHGSAYSHLPLIDRIRPSFVKISNTFGSGFETDPTKDRIVRHTVSLARDFGCATILEGIETPETARAALAAGVDYAQGFHFGRPRAAAHWIAHQPALFCAA